MSETPPSAEHSIGTLNDLGVEVDEIEAAVIAAARGQFEPAILELLEADLSGVEPEVDCNPSEPPP